MAKITKQYLDYSGLNLYNEYIFSKINNLKSTIVNKSDIANDLTTNDATKVLSAEQGVALKGLVDELETALETVHVQADWSQTDETAPDYVKGRTHYVESLEQVFFDGLTQLSSNHFTPIAFTAFPSVGTVCAVEFNGSIYECEVFLNGGMLVVGNPAIMTLSSTDTGEPFLFVFDSGSNTGAGAASETDVYTIKMSGIEETVHKLNNKFLARTVENDDAYTPGIVSKYDITSIARGDWFKLTVGATTYAELDNLRKTRVLFPISWNGVTYMCLLLSVFGVNGVGHADAESVDLNGNVCIIRVTLDGVDVDSVVTAVTVDYPENMILNSSTDESTKHFAIAVDDSGSLQTTDTTDGTVTAIPSAKTATVGQTIVVKTVDDNGVPTEWETVDMPERAQSYTATIGTTWEEDSETGVKYQVVSVPELTGADDEKAFVDHTDSSIDDTSDGYALFVEEENQYLEFITNGRAETVAGGIRFEIFGDANTIAIPIEVRVS